MNDPFAHLHVHSAHSVLDGLGRLADICDSAASDPAWAAAGMQPAIAITDHGNLSGTWRFAKLARSRGVKPIMGCLLAGQEIITIDGVVPVEDVKAGDLVLTHKGTFGRVTRTMTRQHQGGAFEVSLAGRDGRPLTLTDEHPILIRDHTGKVDWKKPGEIRAGNRTKRGGKNSWNSWVCLPKLKERHDTLDLSTVLPSDFIVDASSISRSYSAKGRATVRWDIAGDQKLDYDLGYLLGIYAAEGSLQKVDGVISGGIRLDVHRSEVAGLVEKLRPVLARFGCKPTVATINKPNSGAVLFYSVPLAEILSAMVGCGSLNKTVPGTVLTGNDDVRQGFLDGVLDGDGKSADAASNPTGKRDFSSASKSLAWGIRTLLAHFGHWSTVTSGVGTASASKGGRCVATPYFAVYYSPNRSFSRTIEDDDYIYRPIKAVTPIELNAPVFNFEVEGDHSYVSDFVLHNCEFYVAIGSRHDKNSIEVAADDLDLDSGASDKVEGRKKQKRYEHITVIAINETGWRNLVTLNNIAQDPETAWHKPRIDLELLCEYNEGLVVFTGCLGGPIAGSLARGDNKRAHEIMVMLHDAFSDGQKDPSKKRLFVEVMEHGIELERTLMPKLLRLAKEFNVEVVATNDAHFVEPEHHHHHDAWLCTNTKKTLSDPNRWRFNGEGYHLRSAAEMRRLFDDQNGTGRAVSNSLLIAEMAEEEVIPGSDLRIPEFEPPAGWEPSDRAVAKGFDGSKAYLYDKVWEGALLRYDPKGLLGGDLPSEVKKRLAFEFKTITGMNLHNYFLIVEDLISWARANGIRVGPGRGSAAGCAISYCLGIVQVEPIANGLLFERFLNTERAGMPDIDIDFDAEGRDRVFTYLTQRWGADRVARLGTFGVTLSKGAIRAAARVLDLDAAGETLSRAVPIDTGGKPMAFAKMLDESNPAGADFRRRVDTSDDTRDVVDLAVGFENVIDKEGIHACGVVVSDESLLALVPYRYAKDGQKVTQWDGKDIDEANFLKIDALSLRNLDIVSATVRMIEESTGENLNERRVLGTDENGQPILGLAKIDSPPVDPNDPELSEVEKERCRAAWAAVSEGRTAGLFQLESPGMTQLCMDIRAENLNDLSAIVALYRPGPLGEKMHERYAQRKHGHEPVDYGIFTAGSPNEEAEQEVIAEVLGETFGVPVYQEQLMQLGEIVAGFGPAEKNRLRKAVSKKIKAEMAEVGRIFVEGATSEFTDEDGTVTKIAFAEETASRLWDAMKSAGDYSFNKAHSFAYGWLGYITAYLKANWPTQYGAALLSVTTKSDKRLAVLTSLRDEGIVVSPPCVNESMIHTSVIDGRVVIGLSEIRDVGLTDAEAIIAARSNGPFKSLADLVARTSPEGSRLVKSNAIEGLIEAGAFDNITPEPEKGTRRLGLATIARAVLDHPDLEVPDMEWGVLKKARLERHRLGVLLSQHPLETEVLTKAREFDAELDAEVAAANAKISSDDPFDDYADQAERVDRFGGQLRYASDRGIKARSLRKVVAETTTAPVITIGLVAQWAEKPGAWGRRASFVLDSENAWISGVAWSDTVDLAEKTGNIPEVGDVVVVSGLRKLRRPPQDNSGDPGAVEAEASIERPELTAYVINRAVIVDDDYIGLAPYDLGLAQTAPSDEEIEELIASITPVEEPAPESDPDKPTLFDQLAEPVAEPSDDSVSTDDQVSTDDPFAAEDDPFAEPDLAPAAETDDPFDGPFADPFADPEDGESEQVEDASHVESEPEFEPVGSEEKEDEDEVESDLEPVAEVSEHRRPVMSVVPPLPDTDDDGSDDTDDSGAEASDTSPSVFDAPPGRDHVIAGHTVGRRFAESDLIAEHWNGHTDIVVVELDLAAGEILSKTLYRAITETRPRVEPFLHAAKEWVINRRSCDVTHIRLLERLQKMSRGEPVVVRTKRPGLVQETWFVAPEEVEGAAAYRHLVALVGEMEAGEPKHASHIA